MAENKYLSYEGLKQYDSKLKALVDSKDAATLEAAKEYSDSLADNYEAAGAVATAKQELQAKIDENAGAIETLNGDATVVGSVDKKIADAKSELNTAIGNVKTDADNAQSAADAAQDDVDALEERVAKNEKAIGTMENLETSAKGDLVSALNEVRNAVSAGGTEAAVTIETSPVTDGALKSYIIKQGSNTVGTIDIPKDMVVESGVVVQLADGEVEGCAAGTYIELKLANVTDPLYINVGTLVDIYKAKANATQVQIAIDSSTREISASIIAGSVGTTELADDAVTTVKIADGNVTKAKLSTAVQASLDKADVAESNAKKYADDLNTAMDERVADIEAALGSEGSVDEKIAAAKAEAIAAAATDATNKADAAESAANSYTDQKINAIDLSGIATNAGDIDKLEAALAEGGETYESIVTAKSAADDAQAAAEAAQGDVDALEERVATLEGADTFAEISTSEIDAMFA